MIWLTEKLGLDAILRGLPGAARGRAAVAVKGQLEKFTGRLSPRMKWWLLTMEDKAAAGLMEGAQEGTQEILGATIDRFTAGDEKAFDGIVERVVEASTIGAIVGGGASVATGGGGGPIDITPSDLRRFRMDVDRIQKLPEKLDNGGKVSRADAAAWERVTRTGLPKNQAERTRVVREFLTQSRLAAVQDAQYEAEQPGMERDPSRQQIARGVAEEIVAEGAKPIPPPPAAPVEAEGEETHFYRFKAVDKTGVDIEDTIEAPSEAEAIATIKQMGYFPTDLREIKGRKRKKLLEQKEPPDAVPPEKEAVPEDTEAAKQEVEPEGEEVAVDFEAERSQAVSKAQTLGYNVTPRDAQTPEEQEVVDFLESRGKRASFVDSERPGFNGMIDPDTGFMLLRGDREIDDLWQTVGHEVAHETGLDQAIPTDSDELAQAREDRLKRSSGPYRERLEADSELLDREARADLVGRFLRDEGFRSDLSKSNPGLWQRIREFVLKVVGKWTPNDKARAAVLEELRQEAPEVRPDIDAALEEEFGQPAKEEAPAEEPAPGPAAPAAAPPAAPAPAPEPETREEAGAPEPTLPEETVKRPWEMTTNEFIRQPDSRTQRRKQALADVESAIERLGRETVEKTGWLKPGESVEEWLNRERSQQPTWTKGRKSGQTAIQKWTAHTKKTSLPVFKDAEGGRDLAKAVLGY
ncbi:MAG: hypothetical protein ACYSWU_12475, partial [Planctomycetota bacterium]